ncbi:hypothetical protein MNBD_GAMMA26-2505 [hydrothermal vent metagenome]|uniref:Uncharacterized protein n=1 Tax=hydrothermal vent metagenome TaxID=652676 RepID=A0A3B1AZD9_9ZZZZ
MSVSIEIKQRISKEFNEDEGQHVINALCDYEWLDMEPDRVHRIILDFAKGKISEVERLVKIANDDPRRVLASDKPPKKINLAKKKRVAQIILILAGINVITWIALKFIVQFK